MIDMFAAAEPHIFFPVEVDITLILGAAYTITLITCIIIREFTHGIIRYLLATVFMLSFCVLGYVLLAEYPVYKYLVPLAIVAGVVSGLWVRVGKIFGSIKQH